MKSKIIPILLTCSCASLVHADFNPVVLTPSSYTYDIVVEANSLAPLPNCINVAAGSGAALTDNTFFEQGLYGRSNQLGSNLGIPKHNTIFTDINSTNNNINVQFLMPPDYTTNNELMVDNNPNPPFTGGTLTFNTPTTATNLAILNTGGGGSGTINYTVTHQDTTTETGSINLLDWFNGGPTVAWGATGRVQPGGGYNNIPNYSQASYYPNTSAPYLYDNKITVSGASPIVSISFTWVSGGHANVYAISGNASGTNWVPIPVSGFDVIGTVPSVDPLPVTATMDQGTNLQENDNLGTWFEQGYDSVLPSVGLPPSGSTFNSYSQSTHHYQMGNYSANNAILIDTNHQVSNITPAVPTAYSAIAFLTAGGNVGGTPMTNYCIIQHQDGVNETNLFLGYDWFDSNHNGSIAYQVNGRVNLSSRYLYNIADQDGDPFLFETYFTLSDSGSPVTNIVVKYGSASSTSSTTYVMAVSAAQGAIPPVVTSGPLPTSQTVFPGTNISFTVGVSGSAPITGYWQVENNGSYSTLNDGLDANGSYITGSHTYTLTISNLFVADSTNYQFVANNSAGTGTSPAGTLIVSPQTVTISPATPTYYTGNNIPLTATLSGGPAVQLQWYYIDGLGNTNNIAGATNLTYTITNAPLSLNNVTYGINTYNVYGTNTASVTLAISDSQAFLGGDLSPLLAEAYAGAPVTYTVNAEGNSPITFQWMTNGIIVGGATNNSYTIVTPCGTTTIQAAFSNALNTAWVMTSQVVLQGDASPTNLTFNVNGTGWQTNGSGYAPTFANNVLELTDNGGGEGTSAFYKIAQYIGGAWTASFTYNSHSGGADGAAFILQTTNSTALGGSGGQIGYGGIGNSLAFEINLYGGNNETPGIAEQINGITGLYGAAGPVSTTTGDDINVKLNWANGILSATLTDATTLATYSTNYNVGPLIPILGSSVAYIGFSGGDGGVTSLQTVSNFQFHSILPPVALLASPVVNKSFVISWSAADPTYVLQTATSLTNPSWVAGPTPTVVSGTNQVTISVTGSGQQYYRLTRVVCH